MADLIGTKQDLSDMVEIDKIMHNLGYNTTDYTLTAQDVIVTVGSDVVLIIHY